MRAASVILHATMCIVDYEREVKRGGKTGMSYIECGESTWMQE